MAIDIIGRIIPPYKPQDLPEGNMTKMKRKKTTIGSSERICVGDIVEYHPAFRTMPSTEGVVLRVEDLTTPSPTKARVPIRQRCHCIFPKEGENLGLLVRQFAKKLFYNQDLGFRLVTIEQEKLVCTGECPKEWLQPFTTSEIHTHRFSDLLEENENGS